MVEDVERFCPQPSCSTNIRIFPQCQAGVEQTRAKEEPALHRQPIGDDL